MGATDVAREFASLEHMTVLAQRVLWADVDESDVTFGDELWADVDESDVTFGDVLWADVGESDVIFNDGLWGDVDNNVTFDDGLSLEST